MLDFPAQVIAKKGETTQKSPIRGRWGCEVAAFVDWPQLTTEDDFEESPGPLFNPIKLESRGWTVGKSVWHYVARVLNLFYLEKIQNLNFISMYWFDKCVRAFQLNDNKFNKKIKETFVLF